MQRKGPQPASKPQPQAAAPQVAKDKDAQVPQPAGAH
jgi:hypothetical protein